MRSVLDEPTTLVAELMQSRQTILPKRLLAPGPDAGQLNRILSAAATAPDHGQLLPWRVVLVPPTARTRLADCFASALLERDAKATDEQQAQAREKAHRSPLLMLLVVDGGCGDADVHTHERILSAGCAVQNMLLMATAPLALGAVAFAVLLGFGSGLKSIVQGTLPLALFGSASYGARLGYMAMARQGLAAVAPFVLAVLVDSAGPRWALLAIASAAALGLAAMVAVARINRRPAEQKGANQLSSAE